MKKFALWLCFAGCLRGTVSGQSTIGIPAIKNYSYSDYHAGLAIRDMVQDRNGILYFANDDGLLSFDGSFWKTYALPNKAPVKSIALDSSGRIWLGGQDEIGYFFPDLQGVLRFHSLSQLLPPVARQFADIWNIVVSGDEVFFRTIECIFRFRDGRMTTFDAPGGWRMLVKAGTDIFAEDKSAGLQVFRNGKWEPALDRQTANAVQITGVMTYRPDSLLISTLQHGVYLLHQRSLFRKSTAADAILLGNLTGCAAKIDSDRYAFGTKSGGVLIINGQGKLLERFSAVEGLQNNNILHIGRDMRDNLWVGLENGVAQISYNSAIRYIYPVRENKITSNAVRIYQGRLFIGTSDGLYETSIDPEEPDISSGYGSFREVPGTKGRVWNLQEASGTLLIGHEEGGLVLQRGKAVPFIHHLGVWDFREIAADSTFIASTFTGLRRITPLAAGLTDQGRINDLYESLSCMAMDDSGRIWSSHPYRGIYRSLVVQPGENRVQTYKHYGAREGLPADMNNYVFFIRHTVVAATSSGVYEYDPAADRFRPADFFKPIFKESPVEYLKEDKAGNIWFVSSERVGVIDRKKAPGAAYTVIYFPELNGQTVKGFINIYPYDQQNVFIGSNNGVIHLNYKEYVKTDTAIPILLSSVKAIAAKDSLIYGGCHLPGQKPVRLENRWNSFHFEYSAPLFNQQAGIMYSYKLEGFDRDVSAWTDKTEKDYTNLPPGNYTFSVVARNNLNLLSAPALYSFIVEPAWYQTGWAYFAYFLLFVGIVTLLLKWEQQRFIRYQRKHEEEQQQLQYLHSLEMDRKEKGIIALQNEKLAAELDFKNKELATATMHLVERGGFLVNIKEELINVIRKLNIPEVSHEFKTVFRMMSDTEKNDDDWNSFAIHFDQVHNNFLSTLKARYPNLSPTDLKLCAYLRLNLSSKEIAQLLNISLKGVEISRYRIRKKFQLNREVNLYDFLIDITRQAK